MKDAPKYFKTWEVLLAGIIVGGLIALVVFMTGCYKTRAYTSGRPFISVEQTVVTDSTNQVYHTNIVNFGVE